MAYHSLTPPQMASINDKLYRHATLPDTRQDQQQQQRSQLPSLSLTDSRRSSNTTYKTETDAAARAELIVRMGKLVDSMNTDSPRTETTHSARKLSMRAPVDYGSPLSVRSSNSITAFREFVEHGERQHARKQAEIQKHKDEKGRVESWWETFWVPCCGRQTVH